MVTAAALRTIVESCDKEAKMGVVAHGGTTSPTTLDATPPVAKAERQPAALRMHWLNALIIGATILVWLTLIGGVIAGVGGVVAVTSFGGSSGASEPTYNSDGSGYIDPYGKACNYYTTDDNDYCP